MTLYRLPDDAVLFPDPEEAEPDGLLAVGGDLRPERLVAAYAAGIFPWYDRPPILWFSPDPRGVLRPADLHVPRRLLRRLRQRPFAFTLDTAFARVIDACARAPRPGQRGTWITREMREAYVALHRIGLAHSCEVWSGGELAGGLYGVSLGAAFFAESMFHARTDASKAALVALTWQLAAWDFRLLDCQLWTPHLDRFGARRWPRRRFLTALAEALQAAPTRRGPWRLEPETLESHLRGKPEI